MLSSAVLGALVLAPGVPLALVVGRARRWSSVAVEGLILGISWWLLLGLAYSHLGWYDGWQLVVTTVVAVVALAPRAWRARAEVAPPRATWFAGAMAVLLAVAASVRTDPFYFLYQIGDFGEYVNRSNAVADGGTFIGWFTQGFTVALSLTHLVLGEARTVDLMPFLGLVLLVATVELAARLNASEWARLLVGVVMAVGVVPVWFSRFPASETLYAVLQVGMVLLVVVAVERGATPPALAAGVVAGLLLVTRGNGVLLGPLAIAVVAIGALVVRRRTMDVLAAFLASALLSLGAAFTYNARFSYPYFIAEQLPKFVPDPIFEQLEGMGGLRFALPRLALLVLVTIALVVGLRALHARVGPPNEGPALTVIRRAALPAVLAVALLALATVLNPAGLLDALARYELVVELIAAAGACVALWRFADGMEDHERVGAASVLLTGVTFALLYAERLPRPRYAPYFLYWDRYLFSELFPLMIVAVVWAVWLVERRLPGAVVGVGAVGLGLLLHADAAIIRERTFMDDAYAQLRAIDRLAADDDVPLLFAGIQPEEVPRSLCHPNTHRIVASPLGATFGRRFLNLGLAPYGPDPRPEGADLRDAMRRRDVDDAYLLQVTLEDDDVDAVRSAGLDVERVGSLPLAIPLLDRPLDDDTPIAGDPIAGCARHGAPRWDVPRFTVTVSRVSLR